uniref:ATP synthase subunit a n=1 Tax=Berkeleya fennica TaxID=1577906 RepID=A0A0U1Y184_BERFE|nr:ATPase subunit 6 [Berkeleya fennica]AJA05803.1 ATPase subunit 6 [Berkeleya fennica]
MLHAPLEQFQILSLVSIKIFNLDFSITNFLLINLLALITFLSFIYFNSSNSNYLQETSFYFIPNSWQKLIESISEITAQLISDIITTDNEKYFPVISVLFNFILFSNVIGLIPYTFTATSHLFVTFTLSFSVFIGINVITFEKYKLKSFSLFLPANTTFFLALLLVPIEFISYIAKPVSLGVRLFINLMAGHTLLKVIVGFSWSMLLLENFTSFGLILPLITLVVLFGLELGVALIQTYVFIVLTCIYIQDGS